MSFYAARQPILDADKKLVGYELLYRTSLENIFPKVDEDKATSKMLDGLYFDMGLHKVAEGKTAFINFTNQSLLDNLPILLPKESVTIEVLESVYPSKEMYNVCEMLYEQGYSLALDDFIHSNEWEPFYKLCNVIKVDCVEISETQLNDIIEVIKRHPHIQLLAEKVEDNETFEKFKTLGFTLFQGYFFAKPEVIKNVTLSASQSLAGTLLEEVTKKEVNTDRLIQLFELDAALSYRLLKYVQSPIFRRNRKIESIKQAIVALGHKELHRFVTLLFAATLNEDKPSELIRLSLQRAKFCELLSTNLPDFDETSSFLFGMLSLIDALLDADIGLIVEGLPLSDDIRTALVERVGTLAVVLKICETLEHGDFKKVQILCSKTSINFADVCGYHLDAIDWADTSLSLIA